MERPRPAEENESDPFGPISHSPSSLLRIGAAPNPSSRPRLELYGPAIGSSNGVRCRRRRAAMKCKCHPYERGPGVCASCLRDRLSALVDAQNELSLVRSHGLRPEYRPQPVPLPPQPPLEFPRSVSPYLSHRRSDASTSSPSRRDLRLFFSTPLVGPTFGSDAGADLDRRRRRRGWGKHSILSTLFGHRRPREAAEADPCRPAGSASSSWFSALIRSKRGKKPPPAGEDGEGQAPHLYAERGMSPAAEEEEEEECSSGWRTASSTPARGTPTSRHCRRGGRQARHVSGFAFLLSPLVTVGHRTRRDLAAEAGFSGEHRGGGRAHYRHVPVGGGSSSLDPCRSRKLADLGKFR